MFIIPQQIIEKHPNTILDRVVRGKKRAFVKLTALLTLLVMLYRLMTSVWYGLFLCKQKDNHSFQFCFFRGVDFHAHKAHSGPQKPAGKAREIKIETKKGVKAYNESQDALQFLLSPQCVCVRVRVQARVVCVSVSVCDWAVRKTTVK